MKYIEKDYNASAVLDHKQELIKCQLDELSLLDVNCRYYKETGSRLYNLVKDMITFADLNKQMYRDQGGICCYCGMKLEYPYNPQFTVEHVKPKQKYPELVGEYKNLLLSCRPSQEEVRLRSAFPKKERKELKHCDEAKESKEITYSPLTPNCEKAFIYGIDGSIIGVDDDANKDIETLGLGCDYLKRRRSEAIGVWFEDDISSEDLLKCKDAVMSRDKDNRLTEFCFVISNVIEQFLS